MSDVAGGAVAQPADKHASIRVLLRAGRNDDAIVQLCAIRITQPNDLVAKELLFDAFFQKRDWAPALVLAEELAQQQPGIARLEKAVIATLSNMKRYDQTIVQATKYIERHGEDLTMLDALKVACFYTGKVDEAVRYGQRALDLRDAEACRTAPVAADPQPLPGPRQILPTARRPYRGAAGSKSIRRRTPEYRCRA